MRFATKRSSSGCTVRSLVATRYQLGFDLQAVPSTFWLNRSWCERRNYGFDAAENSERTGGAAVAKPRAQYARCKHRRRRGGNPLQKPQPDEDLDVPRKAGAQRQGRIRGEPDPDGCPTSVPSPERAEEQQRTSGECAGHGACEFPRTDRVSYPRPKPGSVCRVTLDRIGRPARATPANVGCHRLTALKCHRWSGNRSSALQRRFQ